MSATPTTAANSSSTPILDRLLPVPPPMQPSAKRRRVATFVAVIIFLIAVTWFVLMIWSPTVLQWSYGPTQRISKFLDSAGANTFPYDSTGFRVVWGFLSPWMALFAVVAVHELGHMIVGIFAGFRLISIRIGPLQISPPFQVTWSRKGSIPGAAGFVFIVPTHGHRLQSRALAMLLGGPLANLASALAAILLVPETTLFSACFVAFSILIGLVNLIPFRSRAVLSDGKRILMLIRNSRQGERWLALLQLFADLRNGVDPENLRTDFLALATAVQDDSPDTVSAHILAYYAAFHKHDDAEAARLLEVCLRYLGFVAPVMREAIFSDAVGFQAKRRKRIDLADQWLGEIPEKPLIPELRLNAEASILEGQGDVEGALKKLEEAEKIILAKAEPHRRELSLRFLRRWRSELLKQITPANVG